VVQLGGSLGDPAGRVVADGDVDARIAWVDGEGVGGVAAELVDGGVGRGEVRPVERHEDISVDRIVTTILGGGHGSSFAEARPGCSEGVSSSTGRRRLGPWFTR
jgi:hypothetical protein